MKIKRNGNLGFGDLVNLNLWKFENFDVWENECLGLELFEYLYLGGVRFNIWSLGRTDIGILRILGIWFLEIWKFWVWECFGLKLGFEGIFYKKGENR